MNSHGGFAALWLFPLASALALAACSSSSSKAVMSGDAGSAGEAGSNQGGSAGHEAFGEGGDGAMSGEAGALPEGGASEGGAAGEAGAADVPVVVTAVSASPASLDLADGVLYFTVNDRVSGDGKVQSVPVSGGEITTLASGLTNPRNVAVNGGNVYWADTETASGFADVMAVPAAGGTPYEVARCDTNARLVIQGSTLYGLTNDLTVVSSFALTGAAVVGAPVASATHGAIVAYDSDGTSVFWFAPGTTGSDLFQVPLAGGTAVDLAPDATSGSTAFDYITHDASSIYWSDSGTGGVYALAKAGGTVKLLASFPTTSAPVQLLLDGSNVYALRAASLSKFPKAGGTPLILASVSDTGADRYLTDTVNASALAVDDHFVYWTYQGHNQILKIAK